MRKRKNKEKERERIYAMRERERERDSNSDIDREFPETESQFYHIFITSDIQKQSSMTPSYLSLTSN